MKDPINATERLLSRAAKDSAFRARLLADPEGAITQELGVTLAGEHEIRVHEDTDTVTHLALPPASKLTDEEREAARTGAASLEFLKKTLYDPAPPLRSSGLNPAAAGLSSLAAEALAKAGRHSIRTGLAFLESAIAPSGAWHCIRFNIADPEVPRHFERPAFVSAMCVLALEHCNEARARALCARTRGYLVDTMEFPGMWRYYRHLPQDLDSTALCSLVLASGPAHPWMLLGRNVARMLAQRDEDGCFLTWVLEEGEPDVAARFRIEADPVVNANVIAYLGDHPETMDARRWLETLIVEDRLEGLSKWYPDMVSVYYAVTRAMLRARPALDTLRPILADRILGLRDEQEGFGNVLQAAQAIAALYNIDSLDSIDAKRELERLLSVQREDGSWPELLAFGDQALRWGVIGQFGHGGETVTTAFCIGALQHLVEILQN